MEEPGPKDTPPVEPVNPLDSGLGFYAVTFTDIVHSTDHRAQLGDSRADVYHADVDVVTRRAMERFRGVVVKSLGDGLLAIFRAPTDAVHAGVEVQRQLARRNRSAPVAVTYVSGLPSVKSTSSMVTCTATRSMKRRDSAPPPIPQAFWSASSRLRSRDALTWNSVKFVRSS